MVKKEDLDAVINELKALIDKKTSKITDLETMVHDLIAKNEKLESRVNYLEYQLKDKINNQSLVSKPLFSSFLKTDKLDDQESRILNRLEAQNKEKKKTRA